MPVKLAPRARSPEAGSTEGEQGSLAPNARNIANSASAGANSLYNRLGNALAERGEMLSGLQESFDALETGSKNMVSQVRGVCMLVYALIYAFAGQNPCRTTERETLVPVLIISMVCMTRKNYCCTTCS